MTWYEKPPGLLMGKELKNRPTVFKEGVALWAEVCLKTILYFHEAYLISSVLYITNGAITYPDFARGIRAQPTRFLESCSQPVRLPESLSLSFRLPESV